MDVPGGRVELRRGKLVLIQQKRRAEVILLRTPFVGRECALNSTLKSLVFWIVLVARRGTRVEFFHAGSSRASKSENFSEFMTKVDAGQMSSVTITGNEITYTAKSGDSFRTFAPAAVRRARQQADRAQRRRDGARSRPRARGRRCSIRGRRSC